jgi:hypothetical protein
VQECQASSVKTEGNRITVDMRCNVEGTASDARTEMTFGADWYKAAITMRMGKDSLAMKIDAKWLRAGCDNTE